MCCQPPVLCPCGECKQSYGHNLLLYACCNGEESVGEAEISDSIECASFFYLGIAHP